MTFDRGPDVQQSEHFVDGDRCWLINNDGARFLDLFAGAGRALIGHGLPVREIFGQVGVISDRHNYAQRQTAAAMIKRAVGDNWRLLGFFSTGGEAVDLAQRIAMRLTGHSQLAALEGAFHGRIGLARALTDPRFIGEPSDAIRVPLSGLGGFIPSNDTAAITMEAVQGSGGNRPIDTELISTLSALVRATGGLVIADEILGAVARTGAPVAWPEEVPAADLMVLGKGIGNGIPVSAILAHESIAQEAIAAIGTTSSTFGANPLAVAAVVQTLGIVEREDLAQRASAFGALLIRSVRSGLSSASDHVVVSGRGLMVGIDVGNETAALRIRSALHGRKVLVGVTGAVVRVNPPLTITEAEVRYAASALVDSVMEEVA